MTFTLLQQESRETSLQRCKEALDVLPLDKTWIVIVKENKVTRTDRQNRYLWGCAYKAVCEHLPGWDADDVHTYLLGEWSGWERLEAFGRVSFKPVRRSSKLSVQEFSDYVDFIQRTMAAKGIIIPDADQSMPW
jgi:hypothetical protein